VQVPVHQVLQVFYNQVLQVKNLPPSRAWENL
jgi:hypothetical protein